MDIKDWINKKIPGDNFNSWNYDESLKIKELKKTGYPYSLACFNLNEDTIIAIGDADFDKSPSEIIIESKQQNFKLDASMHPKKTKTLYGFKTIFYVKKIRQTEKKTIKQNHLISIIKTIN
jgi:hypothetical protein